MTLADYEPRRFADHPPFRFDGYRSTVKRAPEFAPLPLERTVSELTGPGPAVSAQAAAEIAELDADLTRNAGTGRGAIGQRSIVTGRVLDEHGVPVPHTLVEIWQADAAGRYAHWRETAFGAPQDPNFIGTGRCLTDDDGIYRFVTIKPAPYPWGNHPNAWRPAHIHFSVLGPVLATRLVTQMYFPDDPLFDLDPIFQSVPEHARHRLVAAYDHSVTRENWGLGYRWDIVLRGPAATPVDEHDPVDLASGAGHPTDLAPGASHPAEASHD